jgi:hypothetical protein
VAVHQPGGDTERRGKQEPEPHPLRRVHDMTLEQEPGREKGSNGPSGTGRIIAGGGQASGGRSLRRAAETPFNLILEARP